MYLLYSVQPQGPALINAAHPLAPFLEDAWYPGRDGSPVLYHGPGGREGIYSRIFSGAAADRLLKGTIFSLMVRRSGSTVAWARYASIDYEGTWYSNDEQFVFRDFSGTTVGYAFNHNSEQMTAPYGSHLYANRTTDLTLRWDASSASPSANICIDGVSQGPCYPHPTGSPFPWDSGNPRTVQVGATDLDARAVCVFVFSRVLSDKELSSLRRAPWGMFRRTSATLWPNAAAPAQLQGAAQAVSGASGTLTTQVALAGISSSVATATGSITAAIKLQGSAASVAVASGLLTAQIRLSAAAVSQASAVGSLGTQIRLSGAAQGQSASSGQITTQVELAGAAQVQSASSGQITTQVRLSGAAVAAALASASLTITPSGLSGGASATASSAATLTTAIPLVGSASAISIGSGGLTTAIRLSGVSAAVCAATGTLTVSLGLSAAAVAQATAGGTLSTQIRLHAAAVASALASATLAGTEAALLADPRYRAPGMSRRHESQGLARSYVGGHSSQGGRRYETEAA